MLPGSPGGSSRADPRACLSSPATKVYPGADPRARRGGRKNGGRGAIARNKIRLVLSPVPPQHVGPLAGIAAGGLLASMFMGDGFEGIQMLDILLIALVAFIAFRFIAARRRQQNQGQPAMAGHAPMQREMPAQAPIFGGAAAAAAAPSPVINAPSWFNEERFVGAAREHFMSLQQHWDANEMDKIAEFVTPQMLQWLKQERAEIGDAYQSTYIDNLVVQLDGVDDQADKTIATLTFSGVSKTSRFDQGEAFSESWRMERAQGENQPWLVAGIRQN
ncbi:Tim44 domain-containing protein [Pseudomonas aeruginosa]|uniref:Tim44 domain-containing protein n=1 Tax=Pseudomonas aeruginosa TaxID=287 RepID=UPI0039F4A4EA